MPYNLIVWLFLNTSDSEMKHRYMNETIKLIKCCGYARMGKVGCLEELADL